MLQRRGIILAGGTGSRLFPITITTSKQLLPVYDKPMIYYPLSVLMLSGITEVAIITTPDQRANFSALLGDGSALGLQLTYIEQPRPEGLAQAYLLAEDFLDGHPSAMILGDNIFFGHGLSDVLQSASSNAGRSTIFGYQVSDPSRYGVVGIDSDGRATSVEEKPEAPKSHFAATGLYFLDGDASQRARAVRPSERSELEITDLLQSYLDDGLLDVERLSRGYAWFDTGTHQSLLDAGDFVRTIEDRQGLKIGCIEEVAFNLGLIDMEQLLRLAAPLLKTSYGQYLRRTALSGPVSAGLRDLRSIA
ncbi:MAG: glucose-1-phosphate thymidylyltransferase RfbA [Pseudomonadota bacterium]